LLASIVTWSQDASNLGPACVAIGVFDGVHIGHQALVRDMIAIARERNSAACVLTFDRDPDQVVTPLHAARQLTTLEDKISCLSDLGPDVILIVPFDDWLASLTPDDFCIDVLRDAAEPVACVVGYDFRFGTHASGDADTLRALGSLHGFQVITHPLIHADGAPVTSTRIRALVAQGDVAAAAALLGRPHRLRCEVVHGKRIGHELGTPTANLTVGHEFAVPATGVYAGWATVGGERYPAAISVGVPPTFPDATCDLEAHLIGFTGDLYGQEMVLEFVERVREQRSFPSRDALAQAIADDVARIAALLQSS
jgi:riboflavin kinase/FMN adenylyltransferase